jgi:predicted dehydrogenase
MALEARQAWELVGIAKSAGLCLQVGHIFRFNNALKLVRDLVAHGYFGDVYYLKLQWTTLMDSPLNRDIIFDLGPHPVDILNYLLNKWPLKVACQARAYRRAELEELAYMTMEFDNHVIAHVELSWLQPGKIRDATLIGSQRSAVVDCVNQSIRICENGGTEIFNLPVQSNNTILDETKNYAESIIGKVNHKNTGSSGARNVAILGHLKESLMQEKTIDVDFREER